MDRETVSTHLQIIHTWAEFARERDLQFFTEKDLDSIIAWTDETIAMLKDQEERLRKLQKDKDKLCLEISEWKHKFHDRQIKEQEAVEPLFNEQMKHFVCPNCSLVLDEGRDDYCPSCGKRIAWDEYYIHEDETEGR